MLFMSTSTMATPATRTTANFSRSQVPISQPTLVLEGSIIQDGIEYGVGDYLHALPGSRHSPLSAPRGALLLIRSQSVEHYLRAR